MTECLHRRWHYHQRLPEYELPSAWQEYDYGNCNERVCTNCGRVEVKIWQEKK